MLNCPARLCHSGCSSTVVLSCCNATSAIAVQKRVYVDVAVFKVCCCGSTLDFAAVIVAYTWFARGEFSSKGRERDGPNGETTTAF